MTHRYIGTKEVTAWPQEKDGKPGYGVKYADGYTSWSPKAQFEEAYRTCEPGLTQNLTFGDALRFLKLGRKVARAGWNGKGMWLRHVVLDELLDGDCETTELTLLPWIGMRTADGGFVPWLASQTDMLAEDWMVLA
jgi:hypothetical protein